MTKSTEAFMQWWKTALDGGGSPTRTGIKADGTRISIYECPLSWSDAEWPAVLDCFNHHPDLAKVVMIARTEQGRIGLHVIYGMNRLPEAKEATQVVHVDPRDGDGWTDAVARMGTPVPSYREGYLQSTHWELFKADRKRGQCEVCDQKCPTQLHHVRYPLGAEDVDDVVEVCEQCHQRFHQQSRQQFKKAA